MHRFIRSTTSAIILLISLFFVGACGVSVAENPGDANRPDSNNTLPPADDRPKIVAFGDSLTAGFGLSEKESYPYLLQEKLESEGFNYEVINAGVSGDTTLGGLERIDWVLDQEKVEIVIIELGANDLMRNMPVEDTRSNLDKIIIKAKARGHKVLLCGMLAPPEIGADFKKTFESTFSDLADKHEVEFLPFLLEGVALDRELNQADGIHPNPKGTRIMMENIYGGLKPLLEKRSRS